MYKKQFLMALALLGLAMPASAQLEELNGYVIEEIGEAAESLTEGQWYLIYNKRDDSNTYGGGYFWDSEFTNSGGTGDVKMSYGIDVVTEGMTANAAAAYMVRFVAPDILTGDGSHPEYYLQFGTGRYIWTPTTGSAALQTVETLSEAKTLYAYCINDEAGHFAFNTTDNDNFRIDENGSGKTVVTYNKGDITDTDGNNDFTLYPLILTKVEDSEWALLDLEDVYSEYVEYINGYFNTEGTFACYSAEAVAAFEAAMTAAGEIIEEASYSNPSTDDISAAKQAIIDCYNAVLASYIPLAAKIADGYYFFTCALQFYEAVTNDDGDTEITSYCTKGMYSEANGSDGNIYAKWKTQEKSAPFLWKVTAAGDEYTYTVVNAVTNATFNNVTTSANVTMSEDSENVMVFDQVEAGDSVNLAIRVSTQAEGGSYYLHCGGHLSGAGVSGNIVGWMSDADPSMWVLVPVSDEEVEQIFEAYQNSSDKRYADAQEIITDAKEKMEIAEDKLGAGGLITSVSQLSSPYTSTQEGSFAGMIDGDPDTYWHSDWSGGSVDVGTHYFQVELNEPETELLFTFTRRSEKNDHITLWGVYGTADPDADKDACELLAEISTPFTEAGETITSEVFDSKGYIYLRFYCDDSYGMTVSGTRGYFHVAEFQLYSAAGNETSQMTVMGDIYTNLESAVAAAEEEGANLTEETYNTLVDAYNAFIAVFVDPAELRAALSAAKAVSAGVVTGSNPGYWAEGYSSAASLGSTIEAATAYDAAGAYTQAQSSEYVSALTEEAEAVKNAAIKIQAGKWYKIRFATQAEMESNEWDISGASETSTDDALFGKYICVANTINEEGRNLVQTLDDYELREVCIGQGLYFADNVDIYDDEAAKFRFISVADTAYMIQNKATGLFLKAAGESGAVTLSVHPTLFNVSAIGYGENLISGISLEGADNANLHAQLVRNVLVTWSASEPGTNSGLYIEDINEDVDGDYDGTSFNIAVLEGAVNTFCFPVEVAAQEGTMYGVDGVEGSVVTLKEMEGNVAEAGQPFVFIYGDSDYYYDGDEALVIGFTHGYDIEAKPQAAGELVGCYTSTVIGAGKGIASGNEFTVTQSTNSSVGDNSAYIDGNFATGTELTFEIAEGAFNSIEEAVAAAAGNGNIYTIDGKLVGKGNLNTLKSLGRGVYILGGAKVMVK